MGIVDKSETVDHSKNIESILKDLENKQSTLLSSFPEKLVEHAVKDIYHLILNKAKFTIHITSCVYRNVYNHLEELKSQPEYIREFEAIFP